MSVKVEEEEPVVEEQELDLEVDESTVDEAEAPETDQEEDDDEEDRVVTFGNAKEEEEDPEGSEETKETPGWVKKVRKVNRKLEGENRKLKKELRERSTEASKPPPITLGEKPTLKSVGYKEEKFETELQDWYDRKRQIDLSTAESQKAQEDQDKKYQGRQNQYLTKKEEHGFKDFDDAETMVTGTLNTIQQSVIVHGAEDSALVVYALGKNPKKLEELSRIADPVEFAVQIGKLESSLKVKSRKAPAPEKRVEGANKGGGLGSGDKTLEKLREDAAKSGDYSKVSAYKRKQRSK